MRAPKKGPIVPPMAASLLIPSSLAEELDDGVTLETLILLEDVTDCIWVLPALTAAANKALLNVDDVTAAISVLVTAVAALDDDVNPDDCALKLIAYETWSEPDCNERLWISYNALLASENEVIIISDKVIE